MVRVKPNEKMLAVVRTADIDALYEHIVEYIKHPWDYELALAILANDGFTQGQLDKIHMIVAALGNDISLITLAGMDNISPFLVDWLVYTQHDNWGVVHALIERQELTEQHYRYLLENCNYEIGRQVFEKVKRKKEYETIYLVTTVFKYPDDVEHEIPKVFRFNEAPDDNTFFEILEKHLRSLIYDPANFNYFEDDGRCFAESKDGEIHVSTVHRVIDSTTAWTVENFITGRQAL